MSRRLGHHRYRAKLREVGNRELQIAPLMQMVEISGYDRRQSVWKLIYRVLSVGGHKDSATSLQEAVNKHFEEKALGLFLDLLPAAWGLTQDQVEQLLGLPPSWLRAWRNHEVKIDQKIASDIWKLAALQERIRLLRPSEIYPGFWHHVWAETSPIGSRSPWQAFEEDGFSAIAKIRHFLDGGL